MTNRIDFAQLEITGKCQQQCVHCYADSGPNGDHGTMTVDDWGQVISDLPGIGVERVQFIGGEPTLHPALPKLIGRAAAAGLKTEVYTNLVHVPQGLWDVFADNKVALATSYFSPDPAEHASITGRHTLPQINTNIARAVEQKIPIRAGIIEVLPGQKVDEAAQKLRELGVSNVPKADVVRAVGRGALSPDGLDMEQLCGGCTSSLMIDPSGDVTRCAFTRKVPLGNVKETTLGAITESPAFRRFTNELEANFAVRGIGAFCAPDACNPKCKPMTGCMPWQSCSPNGRHAELDTQQSIAAVNETS